MKIAIMGATGYIGRSLLAEYMQRGVRVDAYVRNIEKACAVFQKYNIVGAHLCTYDTFEDSQYEIIVNAAGAGSPQVLAQNPSAIFSIVEEVDALMLAYLAKYPDTRVFCISSGSVYGGSDIDINNITARDFYSMAKFHSEIKHRAYAEYSIVDLRVFAYFSKFANSEDTFFLSEVVKNLMSGSVLSTSSSTMVRDYATAGALVDVVDFLMARVPANAVYDICSLFPIEKFALLDELVKEFGLQYAVSATSIGASPTGQKNAYYVKESALAKLGYVPKETSLQGIVRELRIMSL